MSELLKLCYLSLLTFLLLFSSYYFSKGTTPVFTRLYIGNLPLIVDQNSLRNTFAQYAQVQDVRILRGNAQGRFDRFCYAFVIIRNEEDQCQEIMNKVALENPGWKMNVKEDDRNVNINAPQSNMPINRYPPMFMNPNQQPIMRQPFQNPNFIPNYYPSNMVDSGEKIIGQKHNKIYVREIWLGGIPEMCDKNYMLRLMGEFGLVQNIQIFPKFAFIRFKLAQDATTAFERAERIHVMFGSPPGFRIFFSDPSRRGNIVSNHYEYDRQSIFIPVLFLGFPPVTSANLDLDHMKTICERYGTITSSYMRRNNNNNNRSYILFTYENQKFALRAKQELNRRRDLLGDKRVDVTLLLNQQSVLKDRDLSYTQTHFQGDGNPMFKNSGFDKIKKPMIQQQQSYPPVFYPTPGFNNPGGFNPQPFYPPGMYYPPLEQPKQLLGFEDRGREWEPNRVERGERQRTREKDRDRDRDREREREREREPQRGGKSQMFHILQSVLESQKPERKQIRKPQLKKDNEKDQDTAEIINKLLGNSNNNNSGQKEQDELSIKSSVHSHKDRDPSWSGFLTWRGAKRVGVDGHCPKGSDSDFSDYNINIHNVISCEDIVIKEKINKLILEPTNSISQATFKQYVKIMKQKIGVSMTNEFVIYIMSKGKVSDSIENISTGELLLVMEKVSTVYYLIKDKLGKCQEML